MIHLVLNSIPISKKNNKRIVYRNKKPIIISSQEYLDWEEVAVIELQQQFQ